jgi:hypothetical protein
MNLIHRTQTLLERWRNGRCTAVELGSVVLETGQKKLTHTSESLMRAIALIGETAPSTYVSREDLPVRIRCSFSSCYNYYRWLDEMPTADDT